MTSTTTAIAPIEKTIEVRRNAAEAFDVFVHRISDWWPRATHTRGKDALGQRSGAVFIEPRAGGRFYERLVDGTELDWGRVTAFEPGKRLVLAWMMGKPEAEATEVAVSFTDLAGGGARVTLVHRYWERMGATGQEARDNYNRGWEPAFVQALADKLAEIHRLQTATVEIIGMAASSFVWTARIAATEKKIAFTHTPANPHSPAVFAIHPLGKIPVMRHGEVALFETKAIATYIDRAFPGPLLIPADAARAALVEQWVSHIVTAIDPPCVRRFLLGYVMPGTADGAPDRAQIEAGLAEMPPLLDDLDRRLAGAEWLVGPGFTLADAFLAPILFYLGAPLTPEGPALIASRPNLAAYRARCLERASVQATMPPQPKTD